MLLEDDEIDVLMMTRFVTHEKVECPTAAQPITHMGSTKKGVYLAEQTQLSLILRVSNLGG